MTVPTFKQQGIATLEYLSGGLVLFGLLAAGLPVLIPLLLWKAARGGLA